SDDDHLSTRQTLLRLQPRNDLSRQKVSTHDQIRMVLAQEFHKRTCVELVECKAPAFVLPGLVELVVKPARHLRHFVDEIDVGFGVEMAKELVGVVKHVDVMHFPTLCVLRLVERLFDRLSGAYMSRAGGG